MKKKNNKRTIVLVACMIAIALIIIGLFVFSNNKSELVLKCSGERETNEYFVGDRFVNVYKKGKDVLYNDNISIEKLTNDEKVNEAIDSYFMLKYQYDEYTKNNFLTLNKDEKKLNLVLDINLSNYTSSQVKEFIGTSDISINGLKSFLELGGLICEEY